MDSDLRFCWRSLLHERLILFAAALLFWAFTSRADIQIAVTHVADDGSASSVGAAVLLAPWRSDAASQARMILVEGTPDEASGRLARLCDGRLPADPDEPKANFFFDAGTVGGRLLFDLGRETEVKEIRTFSRHPGTRGPQDYALYGSDGSADSFNARPASADNMKRAGWKGIARVDTRLKYGMNGGRYCVRVTDSDGVLGKFRYLLFQIAATETNDNFGNTFYSEIDIIENGATNAEPVSAEPFVIQSADGYCEIFLNTAEAPELREWVQQTLAPVLAEWYPKITTLLSSPDYDPPKRFSVILKPERGVAATSGDRITANSDWVQRERRGEAIGALIHEVVHVVQQYHGHRGRPNAKRTPGWLVEGIPDYVRWFLFEPQSHGADLVWLKHQRNPELKYDAGYRPSANFLDYVVENYSDGQSLITQLNAACREGEYSDDLWMDWTGKTLAQLSSEWKTTTQEQINAEPASEINTLTEVERAAGWKLLFNGKDFTGWHNFKSEGVRPGWQVEDGAMVCTDPHNAGDLVTTEKFGAFELQLDYNISEGGNSGIMFHVTDAGGAAWATGPEFQLEDNAKASDPQRCGWLYALYKPQNDYRTGKPIDATKPAGEWNHVRILITPRKSEHWINGVKYLEYVIGSDDFNARVAKSKFASMPHFTKSGSGYIALQGDHGQVSFRNIKVRTMEVGDVKEQAAAP